MKSRQRAAIAARLAVTIVAAIVLSRRVHLSAVLPHRSLTNSALVAAALLTTLAGIVLSAFRWQRVLNTLDVASRLPQLIRHYLASLFVGNVLPSTVGGDVLRVTRLAADAGETPGPFASVILERLSGWIVLPALTFAGLAINPHLRHLGHPTALAFGVGLATLAALSAVLLAAAHPRLGAKISGAQGWRRFTGAVHTGADRFRRHPGRAAEVIAAGVAYQLSVLLAVFLAAKALELPIGFTAVLAFFPVVAIVQTLPITIGGLGVREGALIVFLHPLHVNSSQAVSLGVLIYGCNLTVSLLGAPAFAAGSSRRVRPAT